jgi:GTP pyrophosphokinase
VLLGPRFSGALVFAAELHQDRVRKGTDVPYVAHLLSVAALVIEDGGDEDEAIAALLHDAVEDRGGRPTLEAIRSGFGERVATIVEACSDAEVTPKPPWRERKERYVQHLECAGASVLRVSVADKVHNARAILQDYRAVGEELWSRFKRIAG